MKAFELNGDAVKDIAALAQGAAEVQVTEVYPSPEGQAVGVVVPKTHDYKDLTKEIDEYASFTQHGAMARFAQTN